MNIMYVHKTFQNNKISNIKIKISKIVLFYYINSVNFVLGNLNKFQFIFEMYCIIIPALYKYIAHCK